MPALLGIGASVAYVCVPPLLRCSRCLTDWCPGTCANKVVVRGGRTCAPFEGGATALAAQRHRRVPPKRAKHGVRHTAPFPASYRAHGLSPERAAIGWLGNQRWHGRHASKVQASASDVFAQRPHFSRTTSTFRVFDVGSPNLLKSRPSVAEIAQDRVSPSVRSHRGVAKFNRKQLCDQPESVDPRTTTSTVSVAGPLLLDAFPGVLPGLRGFCQLFTSGALFEIV